MKLLRSAFLPLLLLSGCGAVFAAAPSPAAGSTSADDTPVIPEVTSCRKALKSAHDEVETCRGRCDYGTYCCPIRMCATTSIEAWKKQADTCAEWGVTAAEILWPRPTTGEVDHPECEVQQGAADDK